VAVEVAKLASYVGFHITVMDDREELTNKTRFSNADEIILLKNFENIFKNTEVHANSYIVILTRGHIYDQTVLEQSLKTKAIYIGMIGSKKKRNTIYENLLRKGIDEKFIKSVHCPIGLNIGAQTPEEIAISIVSELIKTRNK
jgi:xanthine dehydrogenase accessory factor